METCRQGKYNQGHGKRKSREWLNKSFNEMVARYEKINREQPVKVLVPNERGELVEKHTDK